MLGYDIANALPGLRAEAESRMTDTVDVGLFEDGTDETTGNPTRVLVTERYSGKARVRLPSQNVTNAQAPSMPVAVQEPVLSIPWGSPRVFIGDEVLVTASDDPVLVGRRFRVQGNAQAGQTTAHRYPLQEIT
jgi:hypothetical protein